VESSGASSPSVRAAARDELKVQTLAPADAGSEARSNGSQKRQGGELLRGSIVAERREKDEGASTRREKQKIICPPNAAASSSACASLWGGRKSRTLLCPYLWLALLLGSQWWQKCFQPIVDEYLPNAGLSSNHIVLDHGILSPTTKVEKGGKA
jgi:hypothetical protein